MTLRCDIPVVLVKSQIIQQTFEVKTQLCYYYIHIQQTMVTANNYMFRPLTGHHQVVHLVKRRGLYNIQCNFCLMKRSHSLYRIYYNQVKLGRTNNINIISSA